MGDAERYARLFHDTYERLAPEHGWETQERSRVGWDDLPPENRALMVAVVAEVVGPLTAERDAACWDAKQAQRLAANAANTAARLTAERDEARAQRDLARDGGEALAADLLAARAEAARLREALAEIARVPMPLFEAQGIALAVIVDGIDAAGTWQSTPPTDQGEDAS